MSSRSTQATHASESAGLLHPFDVLHVVYTYLPDTLGGTEIYAKSLAAEQIKLGLNCAIAAPGARNEDYEIDGLKVARVAAALSTDQLYGAPNPDAQARWQHVLTALHPKILHVHARMPMLSSQTLDFARSLGCKIIYTTHTPSAFCARGTMMEFGTAVCDGKLENSRCVHCVLQNLGAPKLLANLANALPHSVARSLTTALPQKASTLLLMPQRMQRSLRECHDFFASCDHIIAVCDWIHRALLLNGVAAEKLSLNRQGLRSDIEVREPAQRPVNQPSAPLRVLALGRADPHKGFNVLIAAINSCKSDVQLDLALAFGNDDIAGKALADALKQQAQSSVTLGSARVRIHCNVQGIALTQLFAEADLLAAPSTGLETGPLVILEGYSQGLPAIGSDRGGIAELIQDGQNGWLVEPGNIAAWQNKLDQLAQNRELLINARNKIGPVRKMQDVAQEHLGIYQRVLGQSFGEPKLSTEHEPTPPSAHST